MAATAREREAPRRERRTRQGRSPVSRALPSLSFLAFVLAAHSFISPGEARAGSGSTRAATVLVLDSSQPGNLRSEAVVDEIEGGLATRGLAVDLLVEYMDADRNPELSHTQQLYDQYRVRYARRRLDLIAAIGDAAFDFLRRYHGALFRDVPVVFAEVSIADSTSLVGYNEFAGVRSNVAADDTLALIRRLHPEVRTLYVVEDETAIGAWQHRQIEATAAVVGGLRIVPLSAAALTTEQLFRRLRGIGRDGAVLVACWSADRSGRFVSRDTGIDRFAASSAAPMYTLLRDQLGTGIIGGRVSDARDAGRRAATIAVDLLDRKDATGAGVVVDAPTRWAFDYRALERFDLPDGAVPAEAEIVNEPQTFTERFGRLLWIGLCVIGLQAATITWLALNIRRRRRAEIRSTDLESRIRQFEKVESIGELAGGVAHDMNNLLQPILCYSEMALERLRPEDELHEDLREVNAAARRARELVRHLLAFGRRQMLAPIRLDLSAAVREFQPLLRPLVREDVAVRHELADDIGEIEADKTQLLQILVNLCVNANDAMPLGGMITIRTRVEEAARSELRGDPEATAPRYAVLEIADTGCGMSEAVMARIFEPFFTTKEHGHGLGLSTVFGIVRQHNGLLRVHSAQNSGTTFRVFLPLVAGDPSAPRKNASSAPPATAVAPTRSTILLAEDNLSVRELVIRVLAGHGYTVIDASDGASALRLAEQHLREIDLLVTDVVMPGLNGRQLAERVRTLKAEVRVLFISGYTDDVISGHGIREAETHLLLKPFTANDLVSAVREALV